MQLLPSSLHEQSYQRIAVSMLPLTLDGMHSTAPLTLAPNDSTPSSLGQTALGSSTAHKGESHGTVL